MNEKLIKTALGELIPDLILKNARVVNVFTGEIIEGTITITDGLIASVGPYREGKKMVDLNGAFVAPGLIDAHCHIESSMVVPEVYCTEVVRHGVTTLITDPHEITNVAGGDGVRFMLNSAKSCPINYYVMLPSCVPSTNFEHSGAVFTAKEMKPFLNDPHILGLGEMMNYPGVVNCDPAVMEKLDLFNDRVIDGHIPRISGLNLQAYICAGIKTDHESSTYNEALEKLRANMAVLVREGSASKNLNDILSGIIRDKIPTHRMAFCTDDKHLYDIRREGTILHCIRLAIKLGMPPIQAIQMATINAAEIYRLRNIGAVAPGYKADLIILDDLETMSLKGVYKDGIMVNQTGTSRRTYHANGKIGDSVHLPRLTESSFKLPEGENLPVISVIPGQLITKKTMLPRSEVNRLINSGKVRKMVVVERHHATNNIGVGLIAGYGISHGAIGTTVAHDSHNMIIVGDNDRDMLAAARELSRVKGGYTIISNGDIKGTLPLPIGGLMSDLGANEFIPALNKMLKKAKDIGISEEIDPFITLSFMALPVIPEIRLTDMGMFDVTTFSFL